MQTIRLEKCIIGIILIVDMLTAEIRQDLLAQENTWHL